MVAPNPERSDALGPALLVFILTAGAYVLYQLYSSNQQQATAVANLQNTLSSLQQTGSAASVLSSSEPTSTTVNSGTASLSTTNAAAS